jgi:DNA-binding MarR family transcriptional regulator
LLESKYLLDEPTTTIDLETAARLRAALGSLARQLRRTAAGSGLTPTELSVLATLTRAGRLRLTELAAIEGINPTMLSRIAAKLADRGLIVREPDADDRRAARVEATPDGKELYREIQAERTAALVAHVGELPPGQAAALVAALDALEALGELLRDADRAVTRT